QSFGVLDAAGFLQDVDDGVAVAAQGERASGRGQRAGRGEAVTEVAFGGGAQAGVYLAAAQQFQVGGADVGGVHHGGPRPEHVLVVELAGRRDAVERTAGLVLAALPGNRDVQRGAVPSRTAPGLVHVVPSHR